MDAYVMVIVENGTMIDVSNPLFRETRSGIVKSFMGIYK